MTSQIVTDLQVKAWAKKSQEKLISNCLFSQLSNVSDVTMPVGNGGSNQIPDAVVHHVSDTLKKGMISTTVPYIANIAEMGVAGHQVLEGTEKVLDLRYKTVRFNLYRNAVGLKDLSVDSDAGDFYDLQGQAVNRLTKHFYEVKDYCFERALIESCDEFLSEAEYWTGSSISSAPCTRSMHPNFLVRGSADKVTWSATPATYAASIYAEADALTTATVFGKAALESMITQATTSNGVKVQELDWKSKGTSIRFVIKLSEAQANQLVTETGTGAWSELMTNAEKRGVDNRAISGILGIYRGCLVITDPRAPLYDTTAGLNNEDRMQYMKIEEIDNRVPLAKSGAGVGTCEVAALLGKGAIAFAEMNPFTLELDSFDYKFSKGTSAYVKQGMERMDLTNANLTPSVFNQSSFVYMTATTNGTI